MIVKKFGAGVVAGCALLPMLIGCEHEVLVVPARSEMLGQIHLYQPYTVQRDTEMDALRGTDAQPTIDLRYWNWNIPPAEAFERVVFTVDSPGADSSGWSPVALDAGTQISFNVAQIYKNSHVYIGRILTGDYRNTHMLLVVPVGDATLPAVAELHAKDSAYIIPTQSPATQPATAPAK